MTAPPSPLLRMLAKNFGILTIGEALTRLFTLLAFVRLARVLGPASNGYVEITVAVMIFASSMVDQGLSLVGAREVARGSSDLSDWVRRTVSSQLTLAMVVFGLGAMVVQVLPLDPDLRILLLGFGMALFCSPFNLSWVFQGQDRMLWRAIPQALRYGTFLTLSVLVVRGPDDLFRLPIAEIAGAAVAALVSQTAYRMTGGRSFRLDFMAFDTRLLRMGLPIALSNQLRILQMAVPTLVVAALTDSASASSLGIPTRSVGVINLLVLAYLANLYPTFSRAADGPPGQLRRQVVTAIHVCVWPLLLLAGAVIYLSEPALRLFFGEAYTDERCVTSLQILMINVPVFALRQHGQMTLLAMGRRWHDTLCAMSGAAALLLSVVPLVRGFGAPGGAAAILVATSVAALVNLAVFLPRSRGRAAGPPGS